MLFELSTILTALPGHFDKSSRVGNFFLPSWHDLECRGDGSHCRGRLSHRWFQIFFPGDIFAGPPGEGTMMTIFQLLKTQYRRVGGLQCIGGWSLDGEKIPTMEMRPSRLLQANAKLAEYYSWRVSQLKIMMRKNLRHTSVMENCETIYLRKEALNTRQSLLRIFNQ